MSRDFKSRPTVNGVGVALVTEVSGSPSAGLKLLRAPQMFVGTFGGQVVGGTFTPTAGTSLLIVELLGGGGGGGGTPATTATTSSVGGGGAAGTYGRYILSTIAASYSYGVGNGAVGGSNSSGGFGSDTTFGSLVARGGAGGSQGGAGSTAVGITVGGGSGPASTATTLLIPGERGGTGYKLSGVVVNSGPGGSCIYGSGGASVSNANGANADGYGAGGSGAGNFSTNIRTGGTGAPGLIIIHEYGP